MEIPKFGGDFIEYRTFIRAFDTLISSKLAGDNEKLYNLQQYTNGRPREIVRSCLYMDSSEGYRETRNLF